MVPRSRRKISFKQCELQTQPLLSCKVRIRRSRGAAPENRWSDWHRWIPNRRLRGTEREGLSSASYCQRAAIGCANDATTATMGGAPRQAGFSNGWRGGLLRFSGPRPGATRSRAEAGTRAVGRERLDGGAAAAPARIRGGGRPKGFGAVHSSGLVAPRFPMAHLVRSPAVE